MPLDSHQPRWSYVLLQLHGIKAWWCWQILVCSVGSTYRENSQLMLILRLGPLFNCICIIEIYCYTVPTKKGLVSYLSMEQITLFWAKHMSREASIQLSWRQSCYFVNQLLQFILAFIFRGSHLSWRSVKRVVFLHLMRQVPSTNICSTMHL